MFNAFIPNKPNGKDKPQIEFQILNQNCIRNIR